MIRKYYSKPNFIKNFRFFVHGSRDDQFEPRFNKINVHMIGEGLRKQLFNFDSHAIDNDKFKKCVKELLVNNLLKEEKTFIQNLNFPLPKLRGSTLEEHLYELGHEYSYPYRQLIDKLLQSNEIPLPEKWVYSPGWTKYHPDGSCKSVPYPSCDVLVFDVESCVKRRRVPVMAVALSDKFLYSWVSEHFYHDTAFTSDENFANLPFDHLIPMGPGDVNPRLVIGHNVAFDRSYIREEYLATPNFTNFLDTMSMHIVIGGYAEAQRTYLNKKRVSDKKSTDPGEDSTDSPDWINLGSFNSLEALSEYYLNHKIDKQPVDIFVKGDFNDIKQNFDDLMTYCATDTKTTRNLFIKMWPKFSAAAPHPVTLSGMMMLCKCYLPITSEWKNFVERSEMVFNNYQNEMQQILTTLAQKTLREGLYKDSYKNDPWLKNLDWNVTDFKKTDELEKYFRIPFNRKKLYFERIKLGQKITKKVLKMDKNKFKEFFENNNLFPDLPHESDVEFDDKEGVGYPKWFVELTRDSSIKEYIVPNPIQLPHSARLIPLILKLSWRGFSIHYHNKHQWCYVLPKHLVDNRVIDVLGQKIINKSNWIDFSVKKEINNCVNKNDMYEGNVYDDVIEKDHFYQRLFGIYPDEDYPEFRNCHGNKEVQSTFFDKNIVVYEDLRSESYFVPIPHPEGKKKLCGNPLGGEYNQFFLDGVIVPMCGEEGMRYIHLLGPISFWRNNRDRIFELTTVYFSPQEKPAEFKKHIGDAGAIVPRVIPAGTVTRRAVERTWLTVINPKTDTVGSEFKSAIVAPDGFCFVGADVDSEEMWIASLIADAGTVGIHGGTPFSYMSVRGTKQNQSDLHTVTAKAVGISRDDAKILNYGRLYGAGVELARSMIKQYQPHLSESEAAIKAIYLYNFTKGLKCCELTEKGLALVSNSKLWANLMSLADFVKLMSSRKIKPSQYSIYGNFYWQGGTESEIFNILEHFARSNNCKTPFLGVSIPSSLTSKAVGDDFLTSRMNWVVQSSAVDFLHTFLVFTYWLFSLLKIPARLCICVHDEIRFMVPVDKRYYAALALHVSNLYTRSAFSQKLGIYDLPQSCSFFSAVDVDKVLRKEPSVDCKTPSNPRGLGSDIYGFKCETLSIYETLNKVGTDVFTEDELIKLQESEIFSDFE